MTSRSNRKRTSGDPGILGSGGGSPFRHPADPDLSPRMTGEMARNAVYKAVTEMHRTGSLDAGNGDVLDPWLDSLRPQWIAHHVAASADREAAAHVAAGRYAAAAAAAQQRVEARQAERDRTKRLLTVFENRLIMPAEAPATGHPDRRRRPRPGLDALEGLSHDWSWRIVSMALLLAATAGDFTNFRKVVELVTEGQGRDVLILTAAFAAAAVGVMHIAGRLARNVREGQGGLGRPALAVITTVWVALGVTAFYVRLHYNAPQTTSAAEVFGGDTKAVPAVAENPLLPALLLAALFLGAGVLAFYIGFADHHPRMRSFKNLCAELSAQEDDLARVCQEAIEAERLAANANSELARTSARSAAAEASVDAEIAELKELARIHIAGLLGAPAATNNLITGRGLDVHAESGADGAPPIPWPAPPMNSATVASNGHGSHT